MNYLNNKNRKLKAAVLTTILVIFTMTPVIIEADSGISNEKELAAEWEKSFSDDPGEDILEVGKSVEIVHDGNGSISGFITTGGKLNQSYWDMYLIKTGTTGNPDWIKTISDNNSNEYAYCVQQTDDLGFIIVGYKGNKLYLVKTDKNGNIEPSGWEKTFGPNDSSGYKAEGHYVQQTTDGGYIITGYIEENSTTYGDVWLIKTDEYGNMEWNQTFDGYNLHDQGWSVDQTSPDGGYIVTGDLEQQTGTDIFTYCCLLKFDQNGILEYNWTYGDHGTFDVGRSVKQVDDYYILAGWTETYNGSYVKACLIKRYVNGSEGWIKTYPDFWGAYSLDICLEGGYVITGETQGTDIFVLKTDDNGNEIMSNIFGWNDTDEEGHSIQEIDIGKYIVAGWIGCYSVAQARYTDMDVYLAKIIVNTGPNPPSIVAGPGNGEVNIEYCYIFYVSDPNGDNVSILVDWDDNTTCNWTDYVTSGNNTMLSHSWYQEGTYGIKAKAKDVYGKESNWSEVFNVTIFKNHRPNAPIIDGPTEGEAGVEYNYTFNSTDPDGDNVQYLIKWGDGSQENWTGFNASGEEVTVSHKWDNKGEFIIEAQARDIFYNESNWSSLHITMPVYYGEGCLEGTQITMVTGAPGSTKSIEDIRVGDYIQSYDPLNRILAPAEVTAVYEFSVGLPDSYLIFNYDLQVTPKHTLYINGRGWFLANDTELGYYMLENTPGSQGVNLTIISSIEEPNYLQVNIYDLVTRPLYGEARGYWANGKLVGGYT